MSWLSSIVDSGASLINGLSNTSNNPALAAQQASGSSVFSSISQYFYRGVVILTGFIFLTAGLWMFSRPIEISYNKPVSKVFHKKKHG